MTQPLGDTLDLSVVGNDTGTKVICLRAQAARLCYGKYQIVSDALELATECFDVHLKLLDVGCRR